MIMQPLPASSWLNAPAHHAWLAAEGQRLLSFAKASRLPEGFGNLVEVHQRVGAVDQQQVEAVGLQLTQRFLG